jgi:DNA modification methylase
MPSRTADWPNSHIRYQVEILPMGAVLLDERNARVHTQAQIGQIAKSIKSFGFNSPVLVDGKGLVIAGHGRVLALQRMGAKDLPVIRLDHLTPEQARAYAIADNKLTENSTWNDKLLGEHFKLLSELDLDFDLDATGFTMGEIDIAIEGLGGIAVGADPDDAPVPAGRAITQPGDTWSVGPHCVKCGDARERGDFETLMDGGKAALVVADPPYNVAIDGNVSNLTGGKGRRRHREFAVGSGELSEPQFTAFLTTVCRLMADFSTDPSLHFIFMDWRHSFPLMAAGRTAYDDLINICVWTKPSGGMGGLYRSAHEFVLVFKHGHAPHRNSVQLGKFGRNRTNVWNYPGPAGMRHGEDADLTALHPTPKPVAMIADAIMDASARGDVVLDPFGGSGTTLIACERVGRVARIMECDPLYVDLMIRRWQRQTGQCAIVESTGETFNEIAARIAGAP